MTFWNKCYYLHSIDEAERGEVPSQGQRAGKWMGQDLSSAIASDLCTALSQESEHFLELLWIFSWGLLEWYNFLIHSSSGSLASWDHQRE